jgi:UPF0716 protein FxsA
MRIPVSVIVIAPILAEIAGFILVGKAIGVLATLGLVLVGMVAGVALLRHQGLATLRKVQADIAAERVPARPLAEGAVQAFAALLLIVPGFLTDLVAIALFVPAVREALWRSIRRRASVRSEPGSGPPYPRAAVIDLDRTEYDAPRRSAGRPESPWMPPGETPT